MLTSKKNLNVAVCLVMYSLLFSGKRIKRATSQKTNEDFTGFRKVCNNVSSVFGLANSAKQFCNIGYLLD